MFVAVLLTLYKEQLCLSVDTIRKEALEFHGFSGQKLPFFYFVGDCGLKVIFFVGHCGVRASAKYRIGVHKYYDEINLVYSVWCTCHPFSLYVSDRLKF